MRTSSISLIGLILFGLLTAPAARADNAAASEITFTRDVAPIFVSRCIQCHRPGENTPMTLMSYEEARPWAKSIKKVIEKGDMPPWKIKPTAIHFSNDLSLTPSQIATIGGWVDQGAVKGNDADMPAMPKFTEGWKLGEPDYVIELEEVDVPAEGNDYFPNIEVTLNTPADRWIRAVEVRPGNSDVLHHVVGFLGAGMGGGVAGTVTEDDSKPDGQGKGNPGMRAGAATNGNLNIDVLVVWAAGSPPTVYPEGMGRMVKSGSVMTLNMHYHMNGTATKDKTKIGLFFGEGEMKKIINTAFAGTVNFKIPAGAEDHRLKASYIFDQDSHIVSFFPHMHLRGKSMIYEATFPDGRKQELLNVNDYDFNWQWFYYPAELVAAPKGTRIDVTARYDNSARNEKNPDPTKTLTFGEESNDEMMFGVVEYIVDEGMKPKPVNLREKVAGILAGHPAADSYQVSIDTGMLKIPTGLYLPKEGDGAWYFPLGLQLMTMSVTNVKWTGSDFTMTMDTFGGMAIGVKGSVTDAGAIKGEFDMKGMAPAGPQPFAMNGFEGKRIGAAELAASGGGQ